MLCFAPWRRNLALYMVLARVPAVGANMCILPQNDAGMLVYVCDTG